nr:tetratricopeptide repeat protein [Syntrophobacteraceae bacterium]
QPMFGATKEPSVERPPQLPSQSENILGDPEQMSRDLADIEATLSQKEGEARRKALTDLARLYFLLGEYGEKSEREIHFTKGRTFADILCREEPGRVEGYYWLALNLAGLAECGGAGRALGLLPTIIENLKTALEIDENYDQAGPHRVLGCIYCKAPCWPLSEGDIKKSLHHLRRAVEIAPENSTNHLYLAQTLLQLCDLQEARRELQCVLAGTQHAEGPAALQYDRQEALRLMKQCDESPD